MTREEAQMTVAALVAAWPSANVEESTVAIYTTQIEKLANVKAATLAVEALIESREFWPSYAAFRMEYKSALGRIHASEAVQRPALEEGDPEPIPEFVFEFMAGLGSGEKGDPLAEWEKVGPGECADCGQSAKDRFRLSTLDLCRPDALSRLRAKRMVAEADKKPWPKRDEAGVIPQPNFQTMPPTKPGAPANEEWFQRAYQ